MQTVYDVKTGEAVLLNKIDALERIAAGLATVEPVQQAELEPVKGKVKQ